METNNNDNYVLVLEDRTEVKKANEVGKLSVVSGIDEQGSLKTVEPKEAHQAAFLKFNNRDGVLKNFMSNFLKQFNDPTRFGLYKVMSEGIEDSVSTLKTKLQSREKPAIKNELNNTQVHFEDFLPIQKKATAIAPDMIDWRMLENLGVTPEKLEASGDLENMLNWQKSNLVTLAIPVGDSTIYTEARLAFRTNEEGDIGLAIHAMRKEPQLDFPYMGHKFSEEEKEQLLSTGNLGKTIELFPNNREPFSAYVSIDSQTNEIIALRADRVLVPKEIKGVQLTDEQYKNLVEGKAVKVENMLSRFGNPFDATLQINAERKGIEFIFNNQQNQKRRQQNGEKYIPKKFCGIEISDKQHYALMQGKTLFLEEMRDRNGQPFNAYVKYSEQDSRLRFYKYNPDKSEKKTVAVAEENKTQVAVNNDGKTNEATKKVKEPLKKGQTQPTEQQKNKEEKKTKKSKGIKR